MRLGFHTVHFSPMFGGNVDLIRLLDATAAAGFDAIGFDLPTLDAAAASGLGVDAVAAHLRVVGLECSDVVVLRIGGSDDAAVDARRLADVAAALGAGLCVGAVVDGPTAGDQVIDAVGIAAETLHHSGVRLGLEFTTYTPRCSSLAAAVSLVEQVGRDRCGLVLDVLQLARSGARPDDVAQLSCDLIDLVQIADAPARPPADLVHESRHGRLLPGAGALPLREFRAALARIGWAGLVTAEVLSADLRVQEPEVVTTACVQAMRRTWGEPSAW